MFVKSEVLRHLGWQTKYLNVQCVISAICLNGPKVHNITLAQLMAWFRGGASWLRRNGRWGSFWMLFFLLCLPQKLHTSHLMEPAIKRIPFVISWILKTWLVWMRRIPLQVDIMAIINQTALCWNKTERHLKALFGSGCRPYIGQVAWKLDSYPMLHPGRFLPHRRDTVNLCPCPLDADYNVISYPLSLQL